MKWQCRYAPSLGGLEDTPNNVWHTKPYLDEFQPTIFMGLYGLPDFYSLWRHKGKKAILWCGSDIQHFLSGYWLDEHGQIKIEPQQMAEWINKNCESYVENGVEHEALQVLRIESKIVPSFLGKIDDYTLEYKHSYRPAVYLSVSGDNFEMYGWTLIEEIAPHCQVDFYLYGNKKPWVSAHPNVFVKFSEILAKSILWGQHPISYISYPHIDSFKSKEELIDKLNNLKAKFDSNVVGRTYFREHLNKYPWAV